MRNVRYPVFTFVLALLAQPLFATTDFDDDVVPLDLLRGLIQNVITGPPVASSGFHESFPDLALPDSFTVVGSVEQLDSARSVLRSQANTEEAVENLVSLFEDHGYTRAPVPDTTQRTGFIQQQTPQRPVQLCGDNDTSVSVMAGAQQDYTLVTMSISTPQGFPRTFCSQIRQQGQGSGSFGVPAFVGASVDLRNQLPQLLLPEEASQPFRPFIGGGSRGGSGNQYESSHTLHIDWNMDAVYRHFADQVNEQGWSPLGELMEDPISTGHWTKQADPDTRLVGTLMVVESASETFDLRFQLQRLE
jgi:hypothetical protein